MTLKYFNVSEFACPCCGVIAMDEEFLLELDELRHQHGKPLVVSSGYRCPKHNAEVSHTGDKGPHTTGKAVDFAVNRGDAYRLLALAMKFGFTGIGVQQKGNGRFLHLDMLPNAPGQPRPTLWSY